MGVAMLCSRKLMLTDTVNKLQYRLTVLSMRMQGLAMQQVGLLSTGTNSLYGQNNSLAGYVYQGQNPYNTGAVYGTATNGFGAGAGGGGFNYGTPYGATPGGWFGGGISMPDDKAREQQLQAIASIEKVLEVELKALQTQLDMKKKELEAVEKGEKAHIKSITPKYA